MAGSRACAAAEVIFASERALAKSLSSAALELEALVGGASSEHRRQLLACLRKIRGNKVPLGDSVYDFSRQREAKDKLKRALLLAKDAYDEDCKVVSANLRVIANGAAFREALVWQNVGAYRTGLARVATGDGLGRKRHRRAEQMVASYLQRYCVKNETIGFFGPQGSGTITTGSTWSAVPGPKKLKTRRVYFEHWAIAALASRFSLDSELRAHLAPRLSPAMSLDGCVLHHGYGSQSNLSPVVAALIARCDGRATALHIAEAMVAAEDMDFDDVGDVFGLLEDLHEKRVLRWAIDIPTAPNAPDEFLEKLLLGLPTAVAEGALRELGTLQSARDDVAEAAGQPERLAVAIEAINEHFEELTQEAATRSAGQMYAGRGSSTRSACEISTSLLGARYSRGCLSLWRCYCKVLGGSQVKSHVASRASGLMRIGHSAKRWARLKSTTHTSLALSAVPLARLRGHPKSLRK
ncbi:MAG: hypothetical protein GY811_09185 [Myxococcales bacterium]|nr:hypothetical protein [Myxococcales bacterium]